MLSIARTPSVHVNTTSSNRKYRPF
uniref:Uncharacterized protein n=1 Tax=Arundo donax TaxID=35708 RepID=A0A0A9C1T6_ARUDO